MAIDFSKYTAQATVNRKDWKPPISENSMKLRSNKLPVSSRCYPEYLLACLAHMEAKHRLSIDSISDLLYKIVCEYINMNWEEIGQLPTADTALDYFIGRGWISTDSTTKQKQLSNIRHKQTELEAAMDRGELPLNEQVAYWKDRDPEKAELIIQKATEEALQAAMKGMQEGEPSEDKEPSGEKPERVLTKQEISKLGGVGTEEKPDLDKIKQTDSLREELLSKDNPDKPSPDFLDIN